MRAAHAVAPNLPPPPEERSVVPSGVSSLWNARSITAAGLALRPAAMQIADHSGVFLVFV